MMSEEWNRSGWDEPRVVDLVELVLALGCRACGLPSGNRMTGEAGCLDPGDLV
jgi:hypothetical protein